MVLKLVLEKQAAALGPHHPDTLTTKAGLARTYRLLHKYDSADRMLNDALETWANDASYVAWPDRVADKIMGGLALLYAVQNKAERLESQYKDLLARVVAKWGDHDAHVFRIKEELAGLHSTQRRYEEAESIYEELLETQDIKLGPDDWHTIWNQGQLGGVYTAHGRHDKAERLYRQRTEILERKLGPLHFEYSRAQGGLGWALVRQEKFAEAEKPFRASLAVLETLQPDTCDTFATKSHLGGCLVGQKKYIEAEPLLLAGYHGLLKCDAKIPGWGRGGLAPALERLVELYEAWGKPEEADKWRKELDVRRAAQQKAAKEQEAKQQEAKKDGAKQEPKPAKAG
jgi:tetratricopeptide (TPR) repeat protein